ncbi:MAG: hypothetical protein HY401_01550 [Elusimicrobia bacterium]|nr:hypothetical protein [Elusimicrobiota bacterium]
MPNNMTNDELIINSRAKLEPAPPPLRKAEAEGGCGVLGAVSSYPIAGRHIIAATENMKNRGNAKGGGICAAWIAEPKKLGVDQKTLESHYLLAVSYLDCNVRQEVERDFLKPRYEIEAAKRLDHLDNFRDIQGLTVEPPEVQIYFVRAKKSALNHFIDDNTLDSLPGDQAENEFIYQQSYLFNKTYYQSLGDKKAFVLSHAKNLLVLKLVGYAEDCIRYYKLEDFRAHIWIGHQRYPTKGRVWHPGGAHPFIGMHEALVHNGDFANYIRVAKYLRQRKIYPLFLTDTEVSVLLFDLWKRVYGYSLEHTIEALAPTTERDFTMLPKERQEVYKKIQMSCLKGSPDGPWFFILARNDPRERAGELIGITDTAMLRPQVFSLSLAEGRPAIGAIASEKQAIDCFLSSLNQEDSKFSRYADRYWNARGASYSDGGAFVFRIRRKHEKIELACENKFGDPVSLPALKDIKTKGGAISLAAGADPDSIVKNIQEIPVFLAALQKDSFSQLVTNIQFLTRLIDRRLGTQGYRKARIAELAANALESIFDKIPPGENNTSYVRAGVAIKNKIPPPPSAGHALIIDAAGFPAEGPDSLSRIIVAAYGLGWKKFMIYRASGQRFIGCGLGPASAEVTIEVYGSPGDYLASGLDGAKIIVHNSGQDQLGQILNAGELIVHGDVGQTFLYGAKGGKIFVLGNTAGRPLINAVGKPRVVINATSLDYLAESFMAGDPHNNGGFVIINGIKINELGEIEDLETPYPGGNLFSLASGGAIFVRDPNRRLTDDQLNGGRYEELGERDWNLILPLLKDNEAHFGITVEKLLAHQGQQKNPGDVYRKIVPVKTRALTLAYD